jgi:hypothetical protein
MRTVGVLAITLGQLALTSMALAQMGPRGQSYEWYYLRSKALAKGTVTRITVGEPAKSRYEIGFTLGAGPKGYPVVLEGFRNKVGIGGARAVVIGCGTCPPNSSGVFHVSRTEYSRYGRFQVEWAGATAEKDAAVFQ